MPSGLLYGHRQARPLVRSDAVIDLVAWAKNNPNVVSLLPPLPPSGLAPAGSPPYSGSIVLESATIYRPPAGNQCSGLVALGENGEGELLIWGFIYWGPARGGYANRRALYSGRSVYQACKAVNDELAYKVMNDYWYSEGPLRPLSPEQLPR